MSKEPAGQTVEMPSWERLASLPELTSFAGQLRAPGAAGGPLTLDQIAEPSQPFWLAWLLHLLETQPDSQPLGTLWILCRDVTQQDQLANELPIWWPRGDLLYFPQHDAVHFEGALPDPETASERLQTLHTLGREPQRWRVLLVHHESLEETVPERGSLEREELKLDVGTTFDLDELASKLEEAGFERSPQVFERGQYALRGGILDVFPWQSIEPVRIEFFDSEIESIRVFDIDAQTSLRQLERTTLLLKDSSDAFAELKDYIQPADLVVTIDGTNELELPASVRITEFSESTEIIPVWATTDSPLGDFSAGDFVLQEARREQFANQLEAWAEDDWEIRIYFNNRGEIDRFQELVPNDVCNKAGVQFCEGRIARGFTLPGARLAILSDAEIFGRYQHGRTQRLFQQVSRQRRSRQENEFKEFQPDDLVVHAEYGIGRFLDIEQRKTNGQTEDVLVIEYADEAKLYVSLENAYLVSRYVGVGKSNPNLSKLGSGRWMKVRKATERAIKEYAGELLKLQASRQTYKGTTHREDTKWQWEFENAFLYKETRDQLGAIEETKKDMESDLPMDRLICGDVGFGKTEVAIRAAFKAVMSGYQVAMLVPTTVLAQQHYQNFCERMSDYPFRIEQLSRFRKTSDQRQVVKALAEGTVDIVIGTHRLISNDIVFKKLGLVIIDEEQRFGVRHKEKFKERFHLIDILTLSATPIPRTLYMSLMGVRDMSTIETPPPNRLPVHTTICAYDERLVREAIQRERKRDGQVYYLHNRVESIEKVATKIQMLCPGVRTGIGHGQMDKEQLENVMHEFVDGKIDVLVCTTIIESGIDIPNANTIIIDRADRFGLADLYQLRGRVGRAQRKAYAILMLPRHLLTSSDAGKRIKAIRDYSSLGAGFKIAMRDLEIRGAGNLLGTQQSGHIMAVGFDLYCQLLKQSIDAMQGRRTITRIDVPMRIDFLVTRALTMSEVEDDYVPAYIPASYIEEPTLRILAYRQLAELTTQKELKKLIRDWRDRFGKLPEPVENLLWSNELKVAAAHANISTIEIKDGKLMLMRKGDYLMIDGKFPRFRRRKNRYRLQEAAEMVATLRSS